jgi:hypothetical protein
MFKNARPSANSGRGRPSAETVPHEKAIRCRAYEIFLARAASGTPGDAQSDWLQAEREMAGAAGEGVGATRAPTLMGTTAARRQGTR